MDADTYNTNKYAKYSLTGTMRLSYAVSLSVAILGSFATIYTQYIHFAIKIIVLYTIFDIPYTKKDFLLHHLCVLSLVSTNYLYDIDPSYMNYLKLQLLRLEYSTILYNLRPLTLDYYSKTKLMQWIPVVNNIYIACFTLSFFKVRVYDYSVNIILLEDTYNYDIYNGLTPYAHMVLTNWIFYGLNLYWFQLIIFKIFDTSRNPRLNIDKTNGK